MNLTYIIYSFKFISLKFQSINIKKKKKDLIIKEIVLNNKINYVNKIICFCIY